MIDPDNFLEYVVKPTLRHIELYSNEAVQLMLGTALAETGLEYMHQIGGPGIGFFSIEPATHTDVVGRFLAKSGRQKLAKKVMALRPTSPLLTGHDALLDPWYACAVARCRYLYTPKPLPQTVEQASRYWWEFYQTPGGAHGPEHYIAAWDAAH